jgi:eukaryotic-like serine/threonine-protein kinase
MGYGVRVLSRWHIGRPCCVSCFGDCFGDRHHNLALCFLSPYEILAPVGAGGMGDVWKARDTRLGRIVAIKKVKEHHSERFKQEARTIAALNHPYICQLHDIGPGYLVLEYVAGKSLTGPLPEDRAVRLAIQIATAIEAAHKKGIIHRDLKPANIMVTDEGSVKLLDFGLAKLYEQDASISSLPTADYPATQEGVVLGTAAYMSPEQAQGQPADARSDIFSFGLVLYEMLSGKRAFTGDSTLAIMNSIVKDEPPPLPTSPPLEKILRCCLAKQPLARFQNMSEVRNALEQIAGEKSVGRSTEQKPSIAVLPFVNMSGDKEQEYFSDGLAEEIINALAHIPGLKVIARTSAFAFKDKHEDIRKVAGVLGVANVIEGSVRKAGNRIRITAQLIAAGDGSHLWSERYDREMNDVFAIQDEISQSIAETLRLKLAGAGAPARRHTENLEAYNLYLRGRHHFYQASAESLAKCRECFEQAIRNDPNYALAFYGLAKFHWYQGYSGFKPRKEANVQAGQFAQKILELDGMLPEAHAMMGILRAIEFDWKGSETEFGRALELDSQSGEVWLNYIWCYLMPLRRMDEAIIETKRALDLDPLNLVLHVALGICLCFTQRWDEGIRHFLKTLDLDPHYHSTNLMLGLAYIREGMIEEGIRHCDAALEVNRDTQWVVGIAGYGYARAGRTDTARELLKELHDRSRKAYVLPSSLAWIHLGLGEIEDALELLEKAAEEHDDWVLFLNASPYVDALRSHPRYQVLLRKMNVD